LNKAQGTGNKLQVATPKIGEPLVINGNYSTSNWWKF